VRTEGTFCCAMSPWQPFSIMKLDTIFMQSTSPFSKAKKIFEKVGAENFQYVFVGNMIGI
jgi:hypothetical protein